MAVSATYSDDVTVKGTLDAAGVQFNQQVKNADLSPTADIDYTKLEHLHCVHIERAQVGTTAVTSATTHVAHIAKGATGTVVAVKAGCAVVPTTSSAATLAIDVRKATTTMLSAAITISSSHTAYTAINGTLLTTAVISLTAGDVVSVTMTPTTHTSDMVQSPAVDIYIREDAA